MIKRLNPILQKYTVPVLLTAIILLGASLRLSEMSTSLWGDEILSYNIANAPLKSALKSSIYPLSYTLIHFALKLGDSEVLIRLHSFIAGILAIWLIYFVGKTWHSRRTGLITAFLLCISSTHIYYSQEGRFYSLVMLASVLTLWAIKPIIQNPRQIPYIILFILGISIGSLSHLFFLPYAAVLMAVALIPIFFRPTSSTGHPYRNVIISISIFAVALLPWVITVLLNTAHSTVARGLLATAQSQQHFTLTPLSYIKYLSDVLYLQNPEKSTIMFLIAIGGAVLLWRQSRLLSLPIILPFIVLPIPFFLIPSTHFYTARYFTSLLPSALLLSAILLVQLSEYTAKMIPRISARFTNKQPTPVYKQTSFLSKIILIIILALLTSFYLARDLNANHYRDKWKEYAAIMAPYVSPQDIIIHFSPHKLNPATKDLKTNQAPTYMLDFYLARHLGPGRRDLLPQKTFLTIETSDVEKWIKQYPNSNIWVVHWLSRPLIRMNPPIDQLFQYKLTGWYDMFEILPAPTTNLITNGDFEQTPPPQFTTTPHASIQESDKSNPKNHILQLTPGDQHTTTIASFPIKPDTTNTTPTRILDPAKHYTLSLNLEYSNIKRAAGKKETAAIVLTGQTATQKPFTIKLHEFFGWSNWKFQAYPVSTKDYPQLNGAENLKIEIHMESPTGQISVDNIQFEPGPHPTPYVNGTRLPHDQALAQLKVQAANP